jgi:hypothetical protein
MGSRVELPRHAARHRRHAPAGSRRRHEHPPRGGVCATSRGTCCTCTPTSASVSRSRTCSGRGRTSPRAWASVYWWALWALAAAAVVVFRVGVPLWRSVRHGIRVSSVEYDGPRGVVVRMSGRALHRLRARRAVLRLAVPRRPRVDTRAPLLARRRPWARRPGDRRAGRG